MAPRLRVEQAGDRVVTRRPLQPAQLLAALHGLTELGADTAEQAQVERGEHADVAQRLGQHQAAESGLAAGQRGHQPLGPPAGEPEPAERAIG
jgi:hypothetical protein